MRIESNATTIELLLDTNNKNSYKVPRYQRNFSWEPKKQVAAFWADLNDEELEGLFMGTLVFNSGSDGTIEIIDGQQRLLTITILLAVIRDLFFELNEVKSATWLQKHITLIGRNGDSKGYKIIPHNKISKYYRKNIQEKLAEKDWETKEKTEELIFKNYEYLRKEIEKKIKNKNPKNQISYLEKIRDKILDAQVIKVVVTNHDDAYGFFETLNDRGLPLSTADLLKNLLFRLILKDKNSKYTEEELEEKWNLITDNIELNKIKNFIRIFWISKYGNIQEKKGDKCF